MSLSRTEVRELLDRHNLAPSRALGQNFLCDRGIVDKIIRLAGVEAGAGVVEVGPGLGSLTKGLLAAGADVVAVEVDRYLIAALKEAVGPVADEPGNRLATRLKVVESDVREVTWSDVLPDEESWALVANLPYNIATPLILDLLEDEPRFSRMLVMVQREAGERLTAGPGSRTYGIPSVMAAYWAEAKVVASIPADVFLPRPNVDSVLVRVDRRPSPAADVPIADLRKVVRTGFGQRRKMLRRSLSALVDEEGFERAGVPPTARPEQLDLDAWARLAREAK